MNRVFTPHLQPLPPQGSKGANLLACSNAEIEYVETGDQHRGIPIFCLHGIGGNYSSFKPQLEALSAQHRVLAWNMPGYGNSEQLQEVSFANLTQALLKLLDALHIEQAHIVGHSIGGMIAQELALTAPERVTSLALLATTSAFGGKDEHFKTQFLAARLKPLQEGLGMPELARQFVPGIVGEDVSEEALEAAIASMAAIAPAVYQETMRCLVGFNRYQDTPQLIQPSVLIAGGSDRNAPVRTMQKMADKMPRAALHVLENTGHLVNLEAPTRCNEILLVFYKQLTP